ncbi:MAG: hypothetical protein ACPGVU_01140 [Limisphaerales bacterium]
MVRRPIQLLILLFLLGTSLSADTIILRNGKKKTGDILHMDARTLTLQVDDFLQIKLHRAHIREIITNRSGIYTMPVKAAVTETSPSSETVESVPGTTVAEPPPPVGFQVPAPVLLNRADFRPRTTDGGDSDGKMIGADGKMLSDHFIYARDSGYFARKVRDGMIRTTQPDAVDRLSALRYLANEIATVRHLKEDIESGIMLESRGRTQEKLTDTYARFRRESEKYTTKYEEDPMQAEEFPLAQWIAGLVSAVRTYNLARDHLKLHERLSIRSRVDLSGGNNQRGRMLRWRMKIAIKQMEQARGELTRRFRYFFDVGRLPEEPNPQMEQVWVVAHEEAILFPYKKVEGTPVARGIRQHYDQSDITVGKPVLVAMDQVVEYLQRKTIKLPAVNEDDQEMEVDIVEVEIEDAISSRYDSKKRNPRTYLRGWMLADRVRVVSR